MKRLLPFCLVLCATLAVQAQEANTSPFVRFAQRQDSLMIEAYKKRDVAQFTTLLKELEKKYKGLSAAEQKDFAGFYMGAYYNLSCTYALMNQKEPALTALDKAIKAGYTNYYNINRDSDMDNLRGEEAFQKLVQPLREVSDYLYILRKDNRFTAADSVALPRFTYQPADAPELVRLRQTFNLDSVAGGGNEVSRVLNVLHWVHNTIPHDGQHESGVRYLNAYEIASVSRAKKVGVSCGELATVLNECYLALGFKSRKVYCLPKDSLRIDYDSHVINVVYVPSLKKWVWVDPTNDAYVMNEKGELLSIEEVRSRLINDQPMIINPDANWNHRSSTTRDYYLYQYMAKNLYRFYCTLNSKYDGETRGVEEKTVQYVHLYPSGYGRFQGAAPRSETRNEEQKTTFVNYMTHNPAAFWQAPQ